MSNLGEPEAPCHSLDNSVGIRRPLSISLNWNQNCKNRTHFLTWRLGSPGRLCTSSNDIGQLLFRFLRGDWSRVKNYNCGLGNHGRLAASSDGMRSCDGLIITLIGGVVASVDLFPIYYFLFVFHLVLQPTVYTPWWFRIFLSLCFSFTVPMDKVHRNVWCWLVCINGSSVTILPYLVAYSLLGFHMVDYSFDRVLLSRFLPRFVEIATHYFPLVSRWRRRCFFRLPAAPLLYGWWTLCFRSRPDKFWRTAGSRR